LGTVLNTKLKSLVSRSAFWIVPRIYIAYATVVFRTSRIRWIGFEGFWEKMAEGDNQLAVTWHEDILQAAYGFRSRGIAVLVSHSRDGELIARALQKCGFSTVRGSSSRGGPEAMTEMTVRLENEQGLLLGIVVDGPRGPRHIVKPGIIALAKRTGLSIAPIRCRAKRNIVFKSWDRTRLPLPFNRLLFLCGEHMTVPPDADREVFDKLCYQLADRLNAVGEQADRLLRGDRTDR